ncbi:hypothetical protein [Streptococcus suis]|uniref:hypothetical protein n=1 Tax=Streptococcus suis TaxID=1307 RepID=UPI0037570B8D
MTTSNVLPKIKEIVSQVNNKRKALEDYYNKLESAKTELEDARHAREKSFTFETDTKVAELEGFVSRIGSRYNREKQTFENELPSKLRRIEELYGELVYEKWGADQEVRDLTERTIESFKNTVTLLDQYTSKPKEINRKALAEVMDADFKTAFSGQMTFIGADSYSLATAIPLESTTYQKLYSAGRQLGVRFE